MAIFLRVGKYFCVTKIFFVLQVREMLGTPEFVSPEVVNYEPLSLNTGEL